MDLERHKRDWEELARVDPYWAIVPAPGTRGRRWDEREFMGSARQEVERHLARARELGFPERRGPALDFGCGVGRQARVLAEHFDEVVGVDISEEMIRLARRLNEGIEGLRFCVNASADLRAMQGEAFDFVYSQLVLQHLPDERTILGYVAEMLRVLRPGGLLLFQVPIGASRRRRVQGRRRAYAVLRGVGVPAPILYERLGLHPVRMTSAAPERIRACLASAGGEILAAESTPLAAGYRSRTFWVAKRRPVP
ncbi:MAG TPA: class I SAM-dependent methyltransferase [Solirubrobacteraceae bacterium]|jgi:SAM-dependent methyltransferase|nr:class I SAM-dependent methyltransferase [Solirubrobacteraceae bacterium]